MVIHCIITFPLDSCDQDTVEKAIMKISLYISGIPRQVSRLGFGCGEQRR